MGSTFPGRWRASCAIRCLVWPTEVQIFKNFGINKSILLELKIFLLYLIVHWVPFQGLIVLNLPLIQVIIDLMVWVFLVQPNFKCPFPLWSTDVFFNVNVSLLTKDLPFSSMPLCLTLHPFLKCFYFELLATEFYNSKEFLLLLCS